MDSSASFIMDTGFYAGIILLPRQSAPHGIHVFTNIDSSSCGAFQSSVLLIVGPEAVGSSPVR